MNLLKKLYKLLSDRIDRLILSDNIRIIYCKQRLIRKQSLIDMQNILLDEYDILCKQYREEILNKQKKGK